MSDESQAPPPEPPVDEPKRSPLKFVLLVVTMLLVEGVVIVGAMWMIRPPAPVMAVPAHTDEISEDDQPVEILVLEDKLANDRSGATYIYPAEIFVQVRSRNQAEVEAQIERFRNELRADVLAIWRTAEPRHFQEPRLDHLTRRIHDLLSHRFKGDPTDEEPMILKTVIVSGTGFRVG